MWLKGGVIIDLHQTLAGDAQNKQTTPRGIACNIGGDFQTRHGAIEAIAPIERKKVEKLA